MKKIALFGGSFNPVHNGHLAIAGLAVDALQLNSCIFIPTADHPFQKESLITPFNHRYNMLKKVTDCIPAFDAWDGESKREGPSYTVDTIKEFKEKFTDSIIYLIIGTDNLPDFHKWHKYEEILSISQLIVITRPGYNQELPSSIPKEQVTFIASPEWALSSSTLRQYLFQGYSCIGLIDDLVKEYITNNKLYTE